MRIAPLVLTVLVVTGVRASAKDLADWTNVQRLKIGAEIVVVDVSGNRVQGYLTSVSMSEVKLDAAVANQPGLLSPEVFDRAAVREVYRVGKKFERRMSATTVALASAAGLAAGIAVGAAVVASHPSAEDPGQGKLLGGIVGFFFAPAVLAAARGLLSALHKTRLVYRAQPANPSTASGARPRSLEEAARF